MAPAFVTVSDNVLLFDSTKSLPEALLTNHQWYDIHLRPISTDIISWKNFGKYTSKLPSGANRLMALCNGKLENHYTDDVWTDKLTSLACYVNANILVHYTWEWKAQCSRYERIVGPEI